MLRKLEKEKELLTTRKSFPSDNEVFGSADCQEIIEPYDEEEEKQWRERHRQKEKEHRQKLAELRKGRKTEVETEDDLWKLLDALDQEEELEDELHRMGKDVEEESDEECSDDESESGSSSENGAKQSDTELEVSKPKVLKRRVSFKEDKENDREEDKESDENCMKIIFKHSDNPPAVTSESGISNPADIYTNYQKQRMPKSILKPSPSNEICTSEDSDDYIQFSRVNDPTEKRDTSRFDAPKQQPAEPVVQAVGEVVERTPVASSAPPAERPVSRFKATRLANKR
ncbi:cilia- and flagella-associated protein 251-like [Homalodisca vitripennis]|uniref:cilia- and flagella-associated protein 251-like n=1 Tax=Homalodisca vitripennis TaxID=197043 RepID=UPI001EEC722E|nr:cilia- and flagella-associated protein 251-like [Homalodisca vitripennis]